MAVSDTAPGPFPLTITKRLTLAKYQISRARVQLGNPTEFSAWLAGVALHDAAELAVLAIADYVGIPREKRRYLHAFPALIQQKTSRGFFDRALIEEDLSEVRNPAKHRGAFPSVSDVVGLLGRTTLCLEHNCQAYLGLPLSGFSLAESLEESLVRSLVKEAELHIEAERYSSALAVLQRAWLELESDVSARTYPDFPPLVPKWLSHRVPEPLEQVFRELEKWHDTVDQQLNQQALGVDPLRGATFKAVGPRIFRMAGGGHKVIATLEDQVLHTAEAAHFGLSLVIEATLLIQDTNRIRVPRSVYEVRVNKVCNYYETGSTNSIGQLAEGTKIEGARIGGGHWMDGDGAAWFWEDSGRTLLIRRIDADPLTATPRLKFERQRERTKPT